MTHQPSNWQFYCHQTDTLYIISRVTSDTKHFLCAYTDKLICVWLWFRRTKRTKISGTGEAMPTKLMHIISCIHWPFSTLSFSIKFWGWFKTQGFCHRLVSALCKNIQNACFMNLTIYILKYCLRFNVDVCGYTWNMSLNNTPIIIMDLYMHLTLGLSVYASISHNSTHWCVINDYYIHTLCNNNIAVVIYL